MPENMKVLRRRIRSIKATKKVTRAMEMISAAKLRRAEGVLRAGRPYALKLQELLGHLAGSASVSSHPLFQEREVKKATLVVFTADRGLCGSFNANVIKIAEQTLARESDKQWELICVGRKGADHFRRRNANIVEKFVGLSGKPDLDFSRKLNDLLLARFLSGQTDAVYFAYSSFVSMAVYKPTIAKFLSLDPAELVGKGADGQKGPELDYILEPSPQAVFESLLPRYLTSKIYITFAEVFTSEHSARMLAMNNATKSCDDLANSLTLKMNKARQAQITRELIDIVGGAQAISG